MVIRCRETSLRAGLFLQQRAVCQKWGWGVWLAFSTRVLANLFAVVAATFTEMVLNHFFPITEAKKWTEKVFISNLMWRRTLPLNRPYEAKNTRKHIGVWLFRGNSESLQTLTLCRCKGGKLNKDTLSQEQAVSTFWHKTPWSSEKKQAVGDQ